DPRRGRRDRGLRARPVHGRLWPVPVQGRRHAGRDGLRALPCRAWLDLQRVCVRSPALIAFYSNVQKRSGIRVLRALAATTASTIRSTATGSRYVATMQQMGARRGRGMRKSIMDVAWSQFISLTIGKAEEAGRSVVLVDPRNTTKMCSQCGVSVEKTLSERS